MAIKDASESESDKSAILSLLFNKKSKDNIADFMSQ